MSTDLNRRNAFLSPFGTNPFVSMFSPRPVVDLFGDSLFSGFRDVFDSDFGVKTQKTEHGREYRFALPGVARENINIDIDGDVLIVEVDEKSETSARKYSSRVTLAPDVDRETLKAKYVDGLLTILAPQVVNEKKKVAIEWDEGDSSNTIESSSEETKQLNDSSPQESATEEEKKDPSG